MKLVYRVDWFVVVIAMLLSGACGGGGCGGCATFDPIPGGFPAGKRNANATQLRVSSTGLASIAADPAKIIGPLVGGAMNGVIKFPVPASCGGSTAVCCPGGVAQPNCGPLDIDLVARPNDPPRLVLAPQQGASQLNVTLRARIKTEMALPVTFQGSNCTVTLDTAPGSFPDLKIDMQISFVQDATTGTTRINAHNTAVSQLENGDYSLGGDFLCTIGGFLIPASVIEGQLATPIENAINSATCKKCATGDVATCGSPFATACTKGVCQEGNQCLQELGLDGRARGTSLFGGFSAGTTGAIDLYEVIGGYATTNASGIALGMLGGMEPGGAPRDACGPPATEPAPVSVPQSAFFQGNVRPDTNAPFGIAIGVHKSQLDQFAFAGYQGGLLCLTIGHGTVAQLSTDTIGLLSRSLGHLVETASPMAIGLRPQSPPTIALGLNTFTDDGMGHKTVAEPLLDIHFTAMELDFFAAVDDQYIRVFTVVADVHLPVGLQVGAMGELTPVLGNPMDAFTNISVKNSQAVTESPATLAGLFPSLLGLVLPQLSNGLSPIKLPKLGGLQLAVTDITAVDNKQFLAIFANLVTTNVAARPVHTTVELVEVVEPADAIARDPARWAASEPPSVTIQLGGDQPDLEYSIRLDEGTWSAWSTGARQRLAPRTFWLPGVHHLIARARRVGQPETIDVQPPEVEIPIGIAGAVPGESKVAAREAPAGAPFHGQAGSTGCGCSSNNAGDAAPLALVFALLVLPLRRVRRLIARARRLGGAAWLAALAALPGCNCGNSKPCGDLTCMPGDVTGSIGRWTSIAGDDQRVMIATYDQLLGDVVAIDATDRANLHLTAVDGVPTGVAPTHDPSGYRGGVEDAGPNVGAWTSIVLANHTARIAYQDRDAKALKYAYEDGSGGWQSYTVDAGPGGGVEVGPYASLAIDADGHPAIAYLAIGIDDGAGHRVTTLKLARATRTDPVSAGDWSLGTTIASAPGTCAALCTGGQQCIAPVAATDVPTCTAPTTDCAPACSATEACVTGACRKILVDPKVADLPTGTGLFASVVVLGDGRLAVAYYDRVRRALVLAVESGKGANQFAEVILDGNAKGQDRGMWSKAIVAGDGTVHVAYQDAIGDQQMYTTWNGNPGTPEVVDDGTRAGDRTHNVGAGAAIYLVSGAPAIAYQDGLTADVYLATRGPTAWTTTALATGPLLDGFSIAATTGHGAPVIAWDTQDPNKSPLRGLTVTAP